MGHSRSLGERLTAVLGPEGWEVWIPKALFAHELGTNRAWLSNAGFETDNDGRIRLRDAWQEREDIVRRQAERAKKAEVPKSLDAARLEKTGLECEKLELELKRDAGELVHADHLMDLWNRHWPAFAAAVGAVPVLLRSRGVDDGVVADMEAHLDRAVEGLRVVWESLREDDDQAPAAEPEPVG